MCGRFTLRTMTDSLARAFKVANMPAMPARYNIAPGQGIISVNNAYVGREIRFLEWGLVPSWMKNVPMTMKLINARSETVLEKPAFREGFKRRRCLIPADGFYEWQRTGRIKTPFFFSMRDNRPFAFAGLWEKLQTANGKLIGSCTILTTTANETVKPVHERMPVILHPDDYDLWLEEAMHNYGLLKGLLKPYSASEIIAYPVSKLINSPSHEGAALVTPLHVGSA